MGKIAVFDSGMGSLSIIRALQKAARSEITYYADQKCFPYGQMGVPALRRAVTGRIAMLRERFCPDLVIVGSNTPTLLLEGITGPRVLGVLPPLRAAARASAAKSIAILATESVSKSPRLARYVRSCRLESVRVARINASPLVSLVESGAFIDDPKRCARAARRLLGHIFGQKGVDVATLSSTHLPFLRHILEQEFPGVRFVDPAEQVAAQAAKKTKPSARARLSVYTSGDPIKFQIQLGKIGMKYRVRHLP